MSPERMILEEAEAALEASERSLARAAKQLPRAERLQKRAKIHSPTAERLFACYQEADASWWAAWRRFADAFRRWEEANNR